MYRCIQPRIGCKENGFADLVLHSEEGPQFLLCHAQLWILDCILLEQSSQLYVCECCV